MGEGERGYKGHMSDTIYRLLDRDPKQYTACREVLAEWKDAPLYEGTEYEITYKDLFLQAHFEVDPILSGYMLGNYFVNWIHNKKACLIAIPVGSEPYGNSMMKENEAALKSLPAPYDSEVWFGTNESDGRLIWDANHEISPNNIAPDFFSLNESSISMEVGTSHPFTLFKHVLVNKGFAKWSYRSKNMYLFKLGDEEWTRLKLD